MSHGDRVDTLPDGFRIIAHSEGAPYAATADEARRFYGVQFHPEVVHTPDGARLIANFVRHVCGLAGDWTMAGFRDAKIARSEEHTSELQSLMRNSYAVFCVKNKKNT